MRLCTDEGSTGSVRFYAYRDFKLCLHGKVEGRALTLFDGVVEAELQSCVGRDDYGGYVTQGREWNQNTASVLDLRMIKLYSKHI